MKSEAVIGQQTQLALAELDVMAMRNNVGVAVHPETGRHIRYGLMNESKQVNETFKSSDWIGCVPVVIQPRHVGMTLGLFGAFETKHEGWKLTPGDAHAKAQLNFINLIRKNGGIADFISNPRQVAALIGIYR